MREMRQIILCALCALAAALCAISAQADEPKRVRFTWEEGYAVAELREGAPAASLWAMLPLSLDFRDFNNTERIAYPPEKLSTDGAPASYKPEAGDITIYAPWGNIAVFYRSYRDSPGLVPIGRFVEGADKISTLGANVRLEAIK